MSPENATKLVSSGRNPARLGAVAVSEPKGAEMADEERIVEEHEGYHHGERVSLLRDFEDYGLFEGEEGTLHICEVGSEEYGNKHVAMFFKSEDADETSGLKLDPMMAGEDWESVPG
jgi:hypothetical protein